MRITGFRIGLLSAALRVPFKTALRTVNSVEDVVLELVCSDGSIGRGEAPPTAAITGETIDSIIAALRDHICPRLVGRDIEDFQTLCEDVQHAIVGNSGAKAAADIALWDLYAQCCGLPVYKLLGGGIPLFVTDLTISVNSPDIMAKDAEYGVKCGYNVLKIKVGVDPELDLARLKAVRGAAKDAKIRIDANQAWTPKLAFRLLTQDAGRGAGYRAGRAAGQGPGILRASDTSRKIRRYRSWPTRACSLRVTRWTSCSGARRIC